MSQDDRQTAPDKDNAMTQHLTERALHILADDLAKLAMYDRPAVTEEFGAPDTRTVHAEIRDAVAVLLLNLGDYAKARGIRLDLPTVD